MVLMNTDIYANAYGFPYDPVAAQQIEDRNDASAYSYIPEIPRLYLRSHIFGGSCVREERSALVYDHNNKCLCYKKITTPKLQERVFLEIISNAIDNAFKSQRMGVFAPTLDVEMNADMISVKSSGLPIPVDIHVYFYDHKQTFGTCAELIMSVIGAGGNADDTKAKQGGGQNGYGAKLCNVFARFFQIEIGDNVRGFHEIITWQKNMTEKIEHVITPAYNITSHRDKEGKFHIYPQNQNERYNGENFVKITWKQDFRKFGRDYFVEEDMQLYMKYVVEASFIAKFKTTFNGIDLSCLTPTHFVSMLPKSLQKATLVHYELSPEDVIRTKNLHQKQVEDAVSMLQVIPTVELIIIDSPGQDNMHISYTNGIWNSTGGVHTDAVYRAILDIIKQGLASKKGMEDFDFSKFDIRAIKGHCTVIINYRVNNPVFKGQDKERLDKPEPKISFNPDEVTKIKKFALTHHIEQIAAGKILKEFSDTTGSFKNDENFRHADWHGTKNQHKCVLLLCEGNSAGSYLKDWIYGTPERTNKYCTLFLRGKLLNVTKKELHKLLHPKSGNDVIRKIVGIMGLKPGVDYRTPEGAATLEYQEMWAMTDADTDGFHIQSLIMNLLHTFFPTFLMAGKFRYVPTPYIRLLTSEKKGKTKKVFYSNVDYKNYVKQTGDNKGYAKPFKGLGSGGKDYAKEDAQISPIVICNYDDYAPFAMDVAFGKDSNSSAKRKVWIEQCRPNIGFNIIKDYGSPNSREKYVHTTEYFNTNLVSYSIDSFERALPSANDGLKLSQRQSLFFILEHWDYGRSNKGTENLATIAGEAKTRTKYHHGDLGPTIARFTTRFPGSNNVPLLTVHEGQFGSREKNGQDIGAPRYISTDPEDIVKLIFDKELTKLIPKKIEEGKEVEPYWLPTKILLPFMNGVLGVATAYSIDQPSYHPMEGCQWILNYITGKQVFPLIPWFRGFTGAVELELVKGKRKQSKDFQETEEYVKYYEGLTVTTKGIFQVMRERSVLYEVPDENDPKKKKKVQANVKDILITEIPIGIATDSYITWLETKCDKVDKSGTKDTDTPVLLVLGWKGEVSYKSLRLIKRKGINNITVIDDRGIPLQLRNVYQMLKLYCDNMMNLYKDLKAKRLSDLLIKIKDEEIMCKLIELVVTDVILVFKQKRANIFTQMAQYGIANEYYEKVGLKGLDEDGYNEHYKKLNDLRQQYANIEARHHLTDWCEDLGKLYDIFSKDPSYNKLPHHVYPFNYCDIQDLLSGKIKSPLPLKEEVQPPPLGTVEHMVASGIDPSTVQIFTCQQGYQWYVDVNTQQYVRYIGSAEQAPQPMTYTDAVTGEAISSDVELTEEQINLQMATYMEQSKNLKKPLNLHQNSQIIGVI